MLTTSYPRNPGDYAGVFVHELAKELIQRGNNVTVIAPHAAESLRKEAQDGVEIFRFRYFFPLFMQRLAYGSGIVSNLKTSWLAKMQIPFFIGSSFLRAVRPSRRADIIHAHWVANGFVGMLLKWINRKPLIITIHGSDAYYFSRNTIFKRIARFILKRADHVIVVNKEIETLLFAIGIDSSTITVIHNGVPYMEDFLNIPILHKSNNRLLWVGRFSAEKNPLYAVQIFQKVLKSIPSAHLTMVGDGPEQKACRQYSEKHSLGDHITFAGKKDHRDIPEIFSQHSILMLTSHREGLPLTILESLAAGRPVVATRVGGIPEVVQENSSGYTIQVNDLDAFSKHILDLLQNHNKYNQFAERAREFVRKNHTWDKIANDTEKIYQTKQKKVKKILIINGSIDLNVGDATILAGNIVLLKKYFPEAAIWGLSLRSQHNERKYEINFLPIASESLNPFDLIRLLAFSRTCDAIFWGGGEHLKDYTNRLGLIYWVTKIFCIWIVNKNIFGAFQGIGPTKASFSKTLINFIVNKTKIFFVRDAASKEKLLSWGCKANIIVSYDPAILIPQMPLNEDLINRLQESCGLQKQYLDNYVGMAPRNWFHYAKSGWLPHRYLQMIGLRRQHQGSPDTNIMYQRLAELADWVVQTYNTRILFFPMNIAQAEGDEVIAQRIISKMQHGDQACIIKAEECTPYDYISIMASAKLFIGVRLHSTILSTVAGVPSMTFYYVDKGREYFKQIKGEEYSFPIESIIRQDDLNPFQLAIQKLWNKDKTSRVELAHRIDEMKKKLIKDFSAIHKYLEAVKK